MDRKKLLIITGIYPPDIGGPATFIPKFSEEMSKHFEITKIITGTTSKKIQNKNVKIYSPSNNLNLLFKKFGIIIEIYNSLKKSDLVFLNGLEIEFFIANFFLKKKYTSKFSGDRFWEKKRSSARNKVEFGDFSKFKISILDNLYNFFYKKFLQNANSIIVPGSYLKNYLKKRYKLEKNKIFFVKNFTTNNQKLSISNTRTYDFIYIGRFVSHKNIFEIIEFVKNFKNKKLLLVGSGPLEKEIQNHKSQNIIIKKNVKQNYVKSLLSDSVYLIINSDYEGLSHTILEAWSSGTIVLAKNNIGNSELLLRDRKYGIIYDELLSKNFKDIFYELDNNSTLKNLIMKNSFDKVKKEYSISNLSYYLKILKGI